ncbi:putative Gal beta 1,3-GalNAc alpha-2,3-sialyl transferase [Apostichopus japonicus]|uniref:beta-galactoside alpha-2,3-sialyltransferase n=1 Tax=Stichopus japonicus TaxID=307972 RepID=A0A2G8JY25_STIJA|nr:putative Gal beta 1,3-GalNAc alpha-2,3-sialyl transferase [Apostichopus japonicus]
MKISYRDTSYLYLRVPPMKVAGIALNLLSPSNSSYETYKDLAKEIVRNQDVFNGKKPADSVRCAVVGNSGNLKNSTYGKIIDKNDLIIRMNNCPVRKFETDVGSRTTHYIAYPNSYRKRDDLSEALFVMAAFSIKDLQWLKKYLKYRRRSIVHPIAADKDKVFVLNPKLMWHIKHQWGLGKGRWASTGLLSVFFGLHICDEVNIFGFGANSKGNWDHYFESNDGKKNSQFRITKVHDSNAEEKILQMLSDAKKVTIFRGPD